MPQKQYSINIDENLYRLLRAEQKRRKVTIPIRAILQEFFWKGFKSEQQYGKFHASLKKHLEITGDRSFIEYLNSSFVGELIKFLDDTRPSYQDITSMAMALMFFDLEPKKFFITLVTYARYGLVQMKGEE